MISVYCTAHNLEPQLLDSYDKPLGEVVDDVRQHWNEEETGSQMFWLTDESGNILATMLRHQSDNERCITTYADGSVEVHQCEYLLDENGHYEATEVRQIA